MTKFIVCDICGSPESNILDMYKCEICGKDVCNHCVSSEVIDNNETLTLCSECEVKCDFTEYKKVHAEIDKIQVQLSDKYTEAHDILIKMKQKYS